MAHLTHHGKGEETRGKKGKEMKKKKRIKGK